MNAQVQRSTQARDERRNIGTNSWLQAGPTVASRAERRITIASLTPRVPDSFIAEAFVLGLRAETTGSVLLMQLQTEDGGQVLPLNQWDRLFPTLNGKFGAPEKLEHLAEQVCRIRVRVTGDPLEVPALKTLVHHCEEHFRHLVFHLDAGVPFNTLTECVGFSERTFLLLQPTAESLYARDLLVRGLRGSGDAANLRTIVCRESGEEHFNGLLKEMGQAVHGFVHGCPPTSNTPKLQSWLNLDFRADIRRLVREVAHTRVGLVLSSGGARSLAHIGIIQVLEEHGVDVDVIAGCSMGSYIGAVWAYGYNGEQMEKLAREVEHRWGLLELIDPFILPRQGFLRGEKVKGRLKRSIGDVHFSELVRPLRIVATNLATLGKVVFSSGEVATAVHASSAIPGACAPVTIDGELYVDGGIADPLPVDVLRDMGIERIIAVNTIPTSAYLKCRMEMEKEYAVLNGKRPSRIRSFIHQKLNYFAPGNILDTILRAFHGAQMAVAEIACQHADVVLRPLSFDGRWHDFRHPGKYIALGRGEAEEHLAEIKSLLARKEPTYEHDTAEHSLASPS